MPIQCTEGLEEKNQTKPKHHHTTKTKKATTQKKKVGSIPHFILAYVFSSLLQPKMGEKQEGW